MLPRSRRISSSCNIDRGASARVNRLAVGNHTDAKDRREHKVLIKGRHSPAAGKSTTLCPPSRRTLSSSSSDHPPCGASVRSSHSTCASVSCDRPHRIPRALLLGTTPWARPPPCSPWRKHRQTSQWRDLPTARAVEQSPGRCREKNIQIQRAAEALGAALRATVPPRARSSRSCDRRALLCPLYGSAQWCRRGTGREDDDEGVSSGVPRFRR